MPLPFVKHVKSPIQGGVDVDLGPKTLIVGPNGSGKSTVTRALQLALTGTVSEVEGRFDVTDSGRIARLFDRGATEPPRWSVATFDDGTQARWSVPEGKKEGSLTVSGGQTQFDRALVEPLALVRAATLAGDDKQRAFFLSHVGATVTAAAIQERLPKRLADRYARLRVELDPSGLLLEMDLLLKARDACDAKAREANKSAKTLRETLSTMSAGLPPQEYGRRERLLAEVHALEAQVKAAQAAGAGQAQAAERRAQRQAAQAQIAEAQAAIEKLRASGAAVKAEIDTVRQEIEALAAEGPVKDAHRRAVQTIEDTITAGAAKCFCCGSSVEGPALQARLSSVKAWIEQADKTLQARRAKQLRLNELEATFAGTRRQFDAATARLGMLQAAAGGEDPEEAEFEGNEGSGETGALGFSDLGELTAKLEAKRADLAVALTAEAVWRRVTGVRDQAADAEAAVPEWKQLREELAKIMAEALRAGLEGFRAKVQAFLPEPDNFGVRTVGAEMKRLEFGLLRADRFDPKMARHLDLPRSARPDDGVLHTILSGAETARVSVALASAIAGPNYHFIVPTDTGYDAETLTAMLAAFEHAPGQVVIATPTMPAGKLSKAWTLVKLNRKGRD